MIDVTYSTKCTQLMREFGIRRDVAQTTINDRHRGLVSNGLDRIVATHWFDDDSLVLVDTLVTKKHLDNMRQLVRFLEVEAQLVLVLQSDLPAGRLTRDASAEESLALVAASFGSPVTCHPEQPPSFLYSGKWNGHASVRTRQQQGATFVTGTFYPTTKMCELVWAFDLDKYRTWLANRTIGPLIERPPRPNRIPLDQIMAAGKAYALDFSKRHPGVKVRPELIRYGLALTVLRQALGDDWCHRNFFDPDSAEPRFLQTGLDGAAAGRAQIRAEHLGECLFNLQIIHGFSSRVELLKSSSLLSAVTELDAARLIVQSGLSFAFNKPMGRKRSDFAGLLILPSGIDACCEVKMKDEATVLSERSILESFKAALKQVPDAPTIIFLYLPDSWIREPEILEVAVRHANARWFGTSKRTVAVIYFWEEWWEFPSGALGRVSRFREYHNRRSRYYDERNTNLIRHWELKRESGLDWVSFTALAADAIECISSCARPS